MVGAYDPRGADVGIEEPLEPGFIDGTYGRGNDPSLYTRCAEGGVPVSCSKQERFDKRADEIFKQIWGEWAAAKALQRNPHNTSAHEQKHKIQDEKSKSPEAQQTTSTDKPAGSPEDEGTVDIATLPCEDSEEVICTRVARGSLRLTPVVDAGVGADNAIGPKLGKGVPENLKDLVLGLADYGKCGEVFEQLVKTSSKKYKKWKEKSKNGESLIETMYNSLKSVSINPKRSAEGINDNGKVELGDYNNDPRGLFATQQRFALITLQETIHQVFDDDALQRASEKLYDSGKLDPAIKSKVDRKNLYEHALLSAACAKSDQELTNGRPTP